MWQPLKSRQRRVDPATVVRIREQQQQLSACAAAAAEASRGLGEGPKTVVQRRKSMRAMLRV